MVNLDLPFGGGRRVHFTPWQLLKLGYHTCSIRTERDLPIIGTD